MKTTKITVAILAIALVFTACKKKEGNTRDTTDPTISNVLINGKSSIPFASAGETIHVSALFQDDQELGTLDIKVKGTTPKANWSDLKTIDLSGPSQSVEQDLEIMPNANPGFYIISFDFTDIRATG